RHRSPQLWPYGGFERRDARRVGEGLRLIFVAVPDGKPLHTFPGTALELDAAFGNVGIDRSREPFVTPRDRIVPIEGIDDLAGIEAFAHQFDLALLESAGHFYLTLKTQKDRARERGKMTLQPLRQSGGVEHAVHHQSR